MMRRWICGILTLLCLHSLAGCDMGYEYTTYLTSTSGDVQLSVAPIWTKEVPDAPQTYTVEFQGNTYTGTYSASHNLSVRSHILHRYEGKDFDFEVQGDTGKLAIFSFSNSDFSENQVHKQDIPDPEKTAAQIAEKMASAYIDTADYLRTVSSNPVSVDVDGKTYEYTTYSITYRKEICGIPTDDSVRVQVTSKGTLKSVVLGEIGAFDHVKEKDISLEKLEASIEKRLMELEQESGERLSSKDYEILEHALYLTPKKELAVVSRVSVWWEEKTGEMSRPLLQMTTLLQ